MAPGDGLWRRRRRATPRVETVEDGEEGREVKHTSRAIYYLLDFTLNNLTTDQTNTTTTPPPATVASSTHTHEAFSFLYT